MALVPDITFSVVDADTFKITDNTTYGAPELDRNQVRVNFIITRKDEGTDVNIAAPAYNELTVTDIDIDTDVDGLFEVAMTLIEIGPETVIDTATENFLFTENLKVCRDGKRDDWVKSKCGCEKEEGFSDYEKIQLGIETIDAYTALSDFTTARCLLDSLFGLCSDDCLEC